MPFDVDLHRRTLSLARKAEPRPVRFSVIEAGQRDSAQGPAQTMVLIHGFGGRAGYWHHQLDHFQYDYRVIALDLRGHGESDAPHSRYSVEELTADIVAMLDALNVTTPFVLVAHSFGGALAAYFTSIFPERVTQLILIGTAVQFRLKWAGRAVLALPAPALELARRLIPRARLYPPSHVVSAQSRNALSTWNGAPVLARVKAPTLVILGQKDFLFDDAAQRAVAACIPGAEEVIIPVTAHQVMVERPDAVNRAMERFLWRTRTQSAAPALPGDTLTSTRRARTKALEAARPWLKFYDARTPYTIRPPAAPLPRVFEASARRFSNATLCEFFGRTVSYRAIDRLATRFAYGLARLGVRSGTPVALSLPNVPQAVIAYLGILKAGGIAVLIDESAGEPSEEARAVKVLGQCQAAGATCLIATLRASVALKPGLDAFGVSHLVVSNPHAYLRLRDKLRRWLAPDSATVGAGNEAQMARGTGSRAVVLGFLKVMLLGRSVTLPERALGDTAVIVHSTRAQRPTALSHQALLANALQWRHALPDLRPGAERIVAAIPFMHGYGLATLHLALLTGSTLVLVPPAEVVLGKSAQGPRPQTVLDAIARTKATLFPGTPTLFQAIAHTPNVREYGIATIRQCISSGAPLPVEVQEEFEKLTRGRIVEAFGLSEAGYLTHLQPLAVRRRVGAMGGAMGLPLPDTEARVLDCHTGAPCPPDVPGALWVRGPQVPKNSGAMPEEWLRTGDLAQSDEDGFFTVLGRCDEIITLADGTERMTRQLENALHEHPAVKEVVIERIAQDAVLKARVWITLHRWARGALRTPVGIANMERELAIHLGHYEADGAPPAWLAIQLTKQPWMRDALGRPRLLS